MTIDLGPRARGAARWVAAALLGLAPAGCHEPGVTSTTVRKPIPVAELPGPILEAAKRAVPGVKFDEAWRNLERGQALQSYEVRGRNDKGKIREVRLSTTGEVLEME